VCGGFGKCKWVAAGSPEALAAKAERVKAATAKAAEGRR